MRQFYVYILASKSRVLYVGVTNDLIRRVHEHRAAIRGFTARYRVKRLVYFEATGDATVASGRRRSRVGCGRER